jgi:hypothetical protein
LSYEPSAISHEVPEDEVERYQLTPTLKFPKSTSYRLPATNKLCYNQNRLIQTTRRDTTDQTPTNPQPPPIWLRHTIESHFYRNDRLAKSSKLKAKSEKLKAKRKMLLAFSQKIVITAERGKNQLVASSL